MLFNKLDHNNNQTTVYCKSPFTSTYTTHDMQQWTESLFLFWSLSCSLLIPLPRTSLVYLYSSLINAQFLLFSTCKNVGFPEKRLAGYQIILTSLLATQHLCLSLRSCLHISADCYLESDLRPTDNSILTSICFSKLWIQVLCLNSFKST